MSTHFFRRFLSTVNLLLIHGQIVGLVTFTYDKKKFQSCAWRKLYSVFLILVHLAFMSFCMYVIPTITGANSIYKNTGYIIMVANAAYAVTVWSSSILGSDSYIKLLGKMIDFDVQLQTSCVIIDYNKARKRVAFHLLGRYVFVTLLCVYYHFSQARSQLAQKVAEVAAIFLIFFNSAICYQATELVTILKTRFMLLNKQITSLVDSSTTTVPKNGTKQTQKDFAILCKVCTLHHHLSKCVRFFNQAFGVILLAMFAVSFISIVLCLFYTSVALQKTVLNWDEVLYTTAASVPFIVDSIFVCHVCYTTIEEADKAGELIHRIETEDHDTIDEIEMFSLQMANEEVEFSAAGFFPVNYTLVFSIIGGVTTYIIILIQLSATIGKDH
ncbi:hypothetical protein Zmor_019733 [Zophobas morio]|uniref:Gustatory receptor n=1 Tax=Zophobas morio TaxID=2755281 RepID=A0AA38I252_9CUCU|nr:hypothetical protein Zmor_019733 [Zophobas morio]